MLFHNEPKKPGKTIIAFEAWTSQDLLDVFADGLRLHWAKWHLLRV